MESHTGDRATTRRLLTLCIGAVGVVYGDIGTSPLYAIRECFHGDHGVAPDPANVLGLLSLIFWALILVVSIKYLALILRADNRGEGGILALMALVRPEHGPRQVGRAVVVALGLFGAALLYGDGMITPAISVLSAIEGLHVATPVFDPYVVPAAIVILVALFWCQRFGTGGVGAVFGPVTLIWFAVISVLGIGGIVKAPQVLAAVNPLYGVHFFTANGWSAFKALGSVFLVVTGGEALYADMGHFGRRPIRITWFAIVLPALLLNYFGQGALLLQTPEAVHNPFFLLAPQWALYPLVLLATVAAVIASQAVISGSFSLTRQAIQLGYCPRLEIAHTSSAEIGQIYIAPVNWALMLATIGLVVGFQTSSNLAAAYGMAVTATMVITALLFYLVAHELWLWPVWVAAPVAGGFLLIDGAFFAANALKIQHGGWFPLVVGAAVFAILTTWKRGREILSQRLQAGVLPMNLFLADISAHAPIRVPGTAIFMARGADGVPAALLHNLKHNKVLHDQIVLLTVTTEEIPHVARRDRVTVTGLGHGLHRVIVRYGFMEDPDVPKVLAHVKIDGAQLQPMRTTYFLGRETLIATRKPGMAVWRERVFAFLARNAQDATTFFRVPPNRVIEIGAQIEL